MPAGCKRNAAPSVGLNVTYLVQGIREVRLIERHPSRNSGLWLAPLLFLVSEPASGTKPTWNPGLPDDRRASAEGSGGALYEGEANPRHTGATIPWRKSARSPELMARR
jgi:hypothetical protein